MTIMAFYFYSNDYEICPVGETDSQTNRHSRLQKYHEVPRKGEESKIPLHSFTRFVSHIGKITVQLASHEMNE